MQTVVALLLLARAIGALRISEIMYSPRLMDGVLEYVELYNEASESVSLEGYSLQGLFSFPVGAVVAPNSYVVVVADKEQFFKFYTNVPTERVYGDLGEKLSNSQKTIGLLDAKGDLVEYVEYSDRYPWPEVADKFGSSLERVCMSSPANKAGNWIGSPVPQNSDPRVEMGGTPGFGSAFTMCPPFERSSNVQLPIKISEIMYHPIKEKTKVELHEFVEFWVEEDIDVSLFRLVSASGMRFTFPPNSKLTAGTFIVVAKDPSELQTVYGTQEFDSVQRPFNYSPGNLAQYSFDENAPQIKLFGPYIGELSNGKERIALVDDVGRVVETVQYADKGGWSLAADALGEDLDFLPTYSPFYDSYDSMLLKGVSLHRYSFADESKCRACLWHGGLATPFETKPELFQGDPDAHPPTVTFHEQFPVIPEPDVETRITVGIHQDTDKTRALDTAADAVVLEYIVDDPTKANFRTETDGVLFPEVATTPTAGAIVMKRTTLDEAGAIVYSAKLPGFKTNQFIRWRVVAKYPNAPAELTAADVFRYPTLTDPQGWHRFFVPPPAASSSVPWHLFITPKDWGDCIRHLYKDGQSRDGFGADKCGWRQDWNNRFPCMVGIGRSTKNENVAVGKVDIYAMDDDDEEGTDSQEIPGRVAPCLFRFQGSRYNRWNGHDMDVAAWRKLYPGPNNPLPTYRSKANTFKSWSYTLKFPKYAKLNGRRDLLLHKIMTGCTNYASKLHYDTFTSAGLFASHVRFDRLYINGGYMRYMMNLEKWGSELIAERLEEHNDRCLHGPSEEVGDLFKSQGVGTPGTSSLGPYGPGTLEPLSPRCGFTPLQRASLTYGRKTHYGNSDVSHQVVMDLIDGFKTHKANIDRCTASGGAACNAPRAWMEKNFDVDYLLSYWCVQQFSLTWDDNLHNYFMYRRASDKKFIFIPWDADRLYERVAPTSGFFTGRSDMQTQTNYFNRLKDAILRLYRKPLLERLATLIKDDVMSLDAYNRRFDRVLDAFDQTEASKAFSPYTQDFPKCATDMRAWIKTRAQTLVAMLAKEGIQPEAQAAKFKHQCFNVPAVRREFGTYRAPPGRPVGLAATMDYASDALVFRWRGPMMFTGESGTKKRQTATDATYEVEARTDTTAPWVAVSRSDASAEQERIALGGARQGTRQYRVRALLADGAYKSSWSELSYTLQAQKTTAANQIYVTATDANGDIVLLTQTRVDGVIDGDASGEGSSNAGAVVGAVFGVLCCLLLIAGVLFLLYKRREAQQAEELVNATYKPHSNSSNKGNLQYGDLPPEDAAPSMSSFNAPSTAFNTQTTAFNTTQTNFNTTPTNFNTAPSNNFGAQANAFNSQTSSNTQTHAFNAPATSSFPAPTLTSSGAFTGPSATPVTSSSVKTALVLYACAAEDTDELTVDKGQILTVVNDSNADWWLCELNGVQGNVPANYLQVCFSCHICGKAYQLESDVQIHLSKRH